MTESQSQGNPVPSQGSVSEEPVYHPFLHGIAIAVVIVMFILITFGGNVTSLGAGLSVPDWPGTFGHNCSPHHLRSGGMTVGHSGNIPTA